MDRKTGFAAVLVLMSGLFYRGSAPQTSPSTSTPAQISVPSSSAPSSAGSKEGPWTPVCKHFQLEEPIAASGSLDVNVQVSGTVHDSALDRTLKLKGTQPEQESDPVKQFCLDEWHDKHLRRTVLIALVPDPETTHLALMFDRLVESITWAAADGNGGQGREICVDAPADAPCRADHRYAFESYWFPWSAAMPREQSDPDKAAGLEKNREKRLSKPGLLLFHGLTDPNRLLIVFLVGESPTSGVNRTAFHNAWEYATALAEHGDAPPICPDDKPRCLAILGPSFSGSVASLEDLLRQHQCCDPAPKHTQFPSRVFVISGSTTSPPAMSIPPPSELHFCTAVENDTNSFLSLENYLQAVAVLQRDDPSALLIEAETGYGAEVSRSIGRRHRSWLMLRYPRGIATVRNSPEQQLSSASNSSPQTNAEYPQLPLSLKDVGKDAIPAQSSGQTPVSQEAVLLELGATIKREGIRQVGILGTDPLDLLFLTRFVHSAAPNTRVIIFGADLLYPYARAINHWQLTGTVAVTSYPLLSRNQYSEGMHPPRRTQFPYAYSEGEYNALRRMFLPASAPPSSQARDADPLCNSDVKQSPSNRQDYLLDYASPFAATDPDRKHFHNPPVWITVLGRDAWWPVAAYDRNVCGLSLEPSRLFEGPEPAAHNKEEFTLERPSRAWVLFFWTVVLLGALHLLSVWLVNSRHARSSGLRHQAWIRPGFRVLTLACDPELEARRRFHLASAAVVIALVTGLSWATLHASGSPGYRIESLSAAVVCVAAVAEMGWLLRGAKLWWVAVIAFAGGMLAVLSIGETAGPANMNRFAAYRAIHVESGTSLLLPSVIALLAVYIFLWLRLKQLRISEERPALLPDSKPLQLTVEESLIQRFSPSDKMLSAALAGLTVLLWVVLFNPLDTLSTLELPAYACLFIGILAVVVYLLAWTVLRFRLGWRRLRMLLQALERSPIRYAFSCLPKEFSWTTIFTGDPAPPLHTDSRAVEALRKIAVEPRALRTLDETLNELSNPARPCQDPEKANALERELNTWSACLAHGQFELWSRGELPLSSRAHQEKETEKQNDDHKKEKNKAPQLNPRDEFLALRYVNFLRYGFLQMRVSLAFLSYGFILLVIALNVYPFRGHHQIDIVLVIVFLMLAAAVLTTFAQMDRDPLLSRLNDSRPNQLGSSFLIRAISFTALPLLTLVASLVPQIGNFLSSWVEPTLQALK